MKQKKKFMIEICINIFMIHPIINIGKILLIYSMKKNTTKTCVPYTLRHVRLQNNNVELCQQSLFVPNLKEQWLGRKMLDRE
jgi:hypothetical protein